MSLQVAVMPNPQPPRVYSGNDDNDDNDGKDGNDGDDALCRTCYRFRHFHHFRVFRGGRHFRSTLCPMLEMRLRDP